MLENTALLGVLLLLFAATAQAISLFSVTYVNKADETNAQKRGLTKWGYASIALIICSVAAGWQREGSQAASDAARDKALLDEQAKSLALAKESNSKLEELRRKSEYIKAREISLSIACALDITQVNRAKVPYIKHPETIELRGVFQFDKSRRPGGVTFVLVRTTRPRIVSPVGSDEEYISMRYNVQSISQGVNWRDFPVEDLPSSNVQFVLSSESLVPYGKYKDNSKIYINSSIRNHLFRVAGETKPNIGELKGGSVVFKGKYEEFNPPQPRNSDKSS